MLLQIERLLTLCLFFAGYLLFKEFCEQVLDDPLPQLSFYEEVSGTSFYEADKDVISNASFNLEMVCLNQYASEHFSIL